MRGGGLRQTTALDSRVQGSDDVLRAQCLQQPAEILAVRWLRVLEGQLFATILHQSQQEVTMVAVTEGVATCWGRGVSACPFPAVFSSLHHLRCPYLPCLPWRVSGVMTLILLLLLVLTLQHQPLPDSSPGVFFSLALPLASAFRTPGSAWLLEVVSLSSVLFRPWIHAGPACAACGGPLCTTS